MEDEVSLSGYENGLLGMEQCVFLTIINSFKKSGFIKNVLHKNSQTINMDNSAENCTENDWIRLIGLMKHYMEFNDFVIIDDAVTVCG